MPRRLQLRDLPRQFNQQGRREVGRAGGEGGCAEFYDEEHGGRGVKAVIKEKAFQKPWRFSSGLFHHGAHREHEENPLEIFVRSVISRGQVILFSRTIGLNKRSPPGIPVM